MDKRGAPWVRGWREEAKLRLICLPYAGGGTTDFRRWQDSLLPGVDLVPLVLPGREHRLAETPLSDIDALVAQALSALTPMLQSAPYVLYGHSMGAWIAFEMARALRRTTLRAPSHLVIGARRAPHMSSRLPALSDLPDDLFIERTAARYGAIPAQIRANNELMKLFLPAIRADFLLLDRYKHRDEPPLDIPLSAFHGSDDPIEHADDLRAWSTYTTAPFRFHTLPGGHFFLREAIDEVADTLNAILRPLLLR